MSESRPDASKGPCSLTSVSVFDDALRKADRVETTITSGGSFRCSSERGVCLGKPYSDPTHLTPVSEFVARRAREGVSSQLASFGEVQWKDSRPAAV
jgi:hypothetical protein